MMTAQDLSAYKKAADTIRGHLLFDETNTLLDVWLNLWSEGAQTLPDRHKIDPTLMPSILSRIYIIQRDAETLRLRYRIAGEEVNRRYDHTLIGRHLDEAVEPHALARVDAYFRATFERPAVVLLSGILFEERDKPGYGERLLLPIQDSNTGELGIFGLTFQQRVFPDAATAHARSNRTLRISPLATGIVEESDATQR